MTALLSAFALSLTLGLFSAQDGPDRGPGVGEAIPHNLTLSDQTGNTRDMKDLSGENGLVILFNRSLDWCPYCQRQTIEFNEVRGEFEERGYALAVLTYDPVETLAMFAKRRDIGFTLLSDPDSEAIDAFGLRNEDYKDHPFAYGVPHPVIFVLSPTGIVQARLSEEGYKERPPAEQVLEAIDGL